jgi:pimeloyl-ACP methyl ester carboxylesterase
MRVHSHATDESSLRNKATNPNNSATTGYSLTAFAVPLLPRPQSDQFQIGPRTRQRLSRSAAIRWVFSYPSGYPIPYSALLLRRELDALNRTFPNHRQIVLVGHSMGGILSRLMITDSSGDKVWRYFFGTLPAQTKLSPESKALVREALVFKRRRDVARVIFISTPHRGSLIAGSPIGRIASSMIRKSVEFVRLGPEILQASVVQEDPAVMKLKRMPNSIDTLSPNDPFVRIMNALPLAKGVMADGTGGADGMVADGMGTDGVADAAGMAAGGTVIIDLGFC